MIGANAATVCFSKPDGTFVCEENVTDMRETERSVVDANRNDGTVSVEETVGSDARVDYEGAEPRDLPSVATRPDLSEEILRYYRDRGAVPDHADGTDTLPGHVPGTEQTIRRGSTGSGEQRVLEIAPPADIDEGEQI